MPDTPPPANPKRKGGKALEREIRSILEQLGEDPERQGLRQTPLRVEKALKEMTEGSQITPQSIFDRGVFTAESDDLVLLRDIRFYSLCEHHMLPFFGLCHIAYYPGEKIAGLSKLVRLVECVSKRLQVQERLTATIADELNRAIAPRGVAVAVEAFHLCMAMRGVQQSLSRACSYAFRGSFSDHSDQQQIVRELTGGPLFP